MMYETYTSMFVMFRLIMMFICVNYPYYGSVFNIKLCLSFVRQIIMYEVLCELPLLAIRLLTVCLSCFRLTVMLCVPMYPHCWMPYLSVSKMTAGLLEMVGYS